MKLRILLLIACLFCLIRVNAETIHQWDVVTISLKSVKIYSNPYQDIPAAKGEDLLKVLFQGTGGKALNKEFMITGFWYGGSEWRINFAPPVTGSWKYTTISKDRSLNGKKGNFDVVEWTDKEKKSNPVRHGFVRVKKDGENAGHFLNIPMDNRFSGLEIHGGTGQIPEFTLIPLCNLWTTVQRKGLMSVSFLFPEMDGAGRVPCLMRPILFWILNI